jgi:hypothetical protein
MKTTSPVRNVVASLALAILATGSVAQADIVYDNSTGDLNVRLNPGLLEIGDEIVLAPGSRIITDFTFQYWGENFVGNNEEARVRFYLNDGPASQAGPLEPSTLFYDSDWFAIAATTRSTLIFTDFTTGALVPLVGSLPNSLTWTVTFRGVGAGESAGVDLYNPPTVGGNFLEYWENTGPGGWEYRGDSGGTAMNFGARLGVVPEPGIMALGLVGGLTALVLRNRFKRA